MRRSWLWIDSNEPRGHHWPLRDLADPQNQGLRQPAMQNAVMHTTNLVLNF